MVGFGERNRLKHQLAERLGSYFAQVPGASPEEFLLEAVRKEIALAPEPRTGGPDVQLQIRDCLGRLSAARRAAVTLYLEGLKASEIALALGWTQKRVQNMVYRGLEELRECLGPRTTDG